MRTRYGGFFVLLMAAASGCGADEGTGSDGGKDPGAGRASILLRSERTKAGPLTNSFASVAATFVPGSASDPCSQTAYGDCQLEVCPASTTPQPPVPEAGAIGVAGGRQPVKLTPKSDGTYPAWSVSDLLYTGGESITVSASGGAIAAFSMTLTAPASLTITQPAPMLGMVKATKGKDLSVSWSGNSGTPMVVKVSTMAEGKSHAVRCSFAAGSSSGTIPAAALGALPSGSLVLSAEARSDATTSAGKWSISAAVSSAALDGTSKIYSYALQLQ